MLRLFLMIAVAVPFVAILVIKEPGSQACSIGDQMQGNCLSNASASQFTAGQIVYLDPVSGEMLQGEAAATAMTEDARNSFALEMEDQMRRSVSVENLTEQRTPSGAIALDLQGRFQSPLVAIIDPVEGIKIGHVNKEGRLQ